MANLLIGYDLNKQGQDYAKLIEKIKALSTNSWHCLDSTWIIRTSMTTVQVRDALRPVIDSNDELLVVPLSQGEGAWQAFSKECSDWLQANL